MDLIAYVRVSSVGQLDGWGLDAQETAVREWAEAQGHRIVRVVPDEAVRGVTDAADRPGLSEVLESLSAGTGLVVARLDRLARALTVQEAILATAWKSGAQVFTADAGEVKADDPDDPMRTAIRQIMGVMAQLDRAMTVKKMRDGKRVKAKTGGKTEGQYAYGYRPEGTGRQRVTVPDEAEQQVITLMRELRSRACSYRSIASRLATEGIQTRGGKPWSAQAVKNVLDRVTT